MNGGIWKAATMFLLAACAALVAWGFDARTIAASKPSTEQVGTIVESKLAETRTSVAVLAERVEGLTRAVNANNRKLEAFLEAQ